MVVKVPGQSQGRNVDQGGKRNKKEYNDGKGGRRVRIWKEKKLLGETWEVVLRVLELRRGRSQGRRLNVSSADCDSEGGGAF